MLAVQSLSIAIYVQKLLTFPLRQFFCPCGFTYTRTWTVPESLSLVENGNNEQLGNDVRPPWIVVVENMQWRPARPRRVDHSSTRARRHASKLT